MKFLRMLSLICITAAFFLLPFNSVSAQSEQAVYAVRIQNTIETGLSHSLQRAFQEAQSSNAKAILLNIDTLGGNVGAALEIGNLIRSSHIPVIAYVEHNAISAGAYIALNAKYLAMAPGSTMGAAEPRTIDGKTADPKTVAYWASEMGSAAEANGRNSQIARGMVDVNLEISNVKQKGTLVSLTSEEAVKQNMADGIYQTPDEALNHFGFGGYQVTEHKMSAAEQLARFVTHPLIIPLLLIIGIVGLVIEMLIPGVILPGVIGVSAFALFFFGHMVAGFTGWESLLLFLLGVVLLITEIFVTGFGIIGLAGIVAIGASVGVAVYDAKYGVQSFLVALACAGVAAFITIKYFGHRGAWNKLILKDQFTKEAGYVPVKSFTYLLYQQGTALTPLRPSGTAIINDQRFDVVTEGDFIGPGEQVVVVHVEGVRIVVRRNQQSNS